MSSVPSTDELRRQLQVQREELQLSGLRLARGVLERRQAAKDIMATTLKEQRRIGFQLHDGLCQKLTGILMLTTGLSQRMEKDDPLNSIELKRISGLINEAVRQARDTAQGLYPGDLDGTSLARLLEELTSSTQESSGISCRFVCPNPILIAENEVATHLYKIAREGVGNAVKHGKPKLIEVNLVQNDGHIALTIKDDGEGFVGNLQKTKGIGLKLTQYRAHAMNASFQVEANVPHGVILTCCLPKGPL